LRLPLQEDTHSEQDKPPQESVLEAANSREADGHHG